METEITPSDALRNLLVEGDSEALREWAVELHPADLAALLRDLSIEEGVHVFHLLPDEESAAVLAESDEDLRTQLIENLPAEDLSRILEQMDPDDAADVVGEIEDPERFRKVLSLVSEVERAEIEGLLVHDEESAGGIMTSEYLAFPVYWTVQATINFLRQAPPDTHFNTAFTIDNQGRLKGMFPIQRLVWTPPTKRLMEITNPDVLSVTADTDQEEVARLFSKYDLVAIPVVDEEGRLTGRITVDDILDVVQEESSEDMFKLAGTSDDELVTRSARAVLTLRLPWMLIALVGGGVCALILGLFETELSTYTYLAFYLPVIMSMGGNIGTQSSTLMVRGIATGQIGGGGIGRTIFKELRVGLLMGGICGFLTGSFAAAYSNLSGDTPLVGLIVALSMTLSMTFSTIYASLVPLTLNRLGIDPAVASAPFISMSNDALGLSIYLTIIRILQPYLAP
jgi:magnesium transporter